MTKATEIMRRSRVRDALQVSLRKPDALTRMREDELDILALAGVLTIERTRGGRAWVLTEIGTMLAEAIRSERKMWNVEMEHREEVYALGDTAGGGW